ncbi:MAG: YfaZ family protein [Nitrococcus sp.]|nr:YfaZ family protein [Nitrococcus sp.]
MRFCLMGLLLLPMLITTSALATSLDVNLSGHAVRAGLTQQLTKSGLEIGGNWLHHMDHGDVLAAALHLVDYPEPGRGALRLGVGGKLLVIDEDEPSVEGVALALGGKVRYTWPTFNRVGIGAHVYFAPQVSSGGDVERYFEGALRAEYLILRNANAYLGVRTVRVGDDRRNETHDFDSAVFLGLRLDF